MYYLLFLFTILGGMIDFRIKYLNYWDEIALLIVLLLWIRKGVLRSIKKDNKSARLMLIIVFLVGLGIISNFVNVGIQKSYVAIIKDIYAFIKFPMIMILLPQIYQPSQKHISKICTICKCIVIITALVAFVGYYFEIGVYLCEPDRMLKTFEFYYRHTTFFVSSYICILIMFIQDSMKKNKGYILLTCLLLFMSQRTKAFFIIAVTIAVFVVGEKKIKKLYYELSNKIKFKKKYIYIVMVIAVVSAWLLGKNKILYHFSYGVSAARPALYIIGIKIMMDFFPIGSGWGTFASYISGEYYSDIYNMYGISDVNGLEQQNYAYVGDVFWPYIYGQFGVFGCLAYIWIIYKLFMNQFVKLKNYDTIIAFGIIWIYALFASTAEAYFTNATGVQMAIILKMYIKNETKETSEVYIDE